jgi:hypothetical protein
MRTDELLPIGCQGEPAHYMCLWGGCIDAVVCLVSWSFPVLQSTPHRPTHPSKPSLTYSLLHPSLLTWLISNRPPTPVPANDSVNDLSTLDSRLLNGLNSARPPPPYHPSWVRNQPTTLNPLPRHPRSTVRESLRRPTRVVLAPV